MAPTENEQFVRDLYDSWNRGERERLFERLHPDAEMTSRLSEVRGRPYRGVDGFREWFADVDEQFSGFELVIDELDEVEPGKVFAVGKVKLRGRASGLTMDQETIWIVEINEQGQLSRMSIFTDRDEAERAAGIDG